MSGAFQFSIRLLLVATACIALAVAAISAKPSWPSMFALELLSVGFATISIDAAIGTTGKVRSFWIGVSVPNVLAAVLAVMAICVCYPVLDFKVSHQFFEAVVDFIRFGIVPFWLFAPLNGVLVLLLKWVALSSPPRD